MDFETMDASVANRHTSNNVNTTVSVISIHHPNKFLSLINQLISYKKFLNPKFPGSNRLKILIMSILLGDLEYFLAVLCIVVVDQVLAPVVVVCERLVQLQVQLVGRFLLELGHSDFVEGHVLKQLARCASFFRVELQHLLKEVDYFRTAVPEFLLEVIDTL